jgi:hypothetical protein
MANNTNSIRLLPSIFQTVTERKFFDATFDQVFSKRNAERLTGYIGRRINGEYNPLEDFYIPEPDKDRTWYQLEPTEFSTDIETLEKTNLFFYQDMIDRIRYYGGNVENHDRLFNSRTYSYSPPIDVDKFINYQNYFWVPGKLQPITVTGISDQDINDYILGKRQFDINEFNSLTGGSAGPADLYFSNGMRIIFQGSTTYPDVITVEGVGSSIVFVPEYNQIIASSEQRFLPWDINFPVPQVNGNSGIWDSMNWDTYDAESITPDYITMERGAIDQNAWSRTNKWYHTDTINQSLRYTGTGFPSGATRALRPIIEFFRNIELFGSGDTFLAQVDYYCQDGITTCGSNSLQYAQVQNQTIADVQNFLPDVSDGDLIVFPCDPGYLSVSFWDKSSTGPNEIWDNESVSEPWDEPLLDIFGEPYSLRGFIWQVNFSGNQIELTIWNNGQPVIDPGDARIVEGSIIQVVGGVPAGNDPAHPNTEHQGETYYFRDGYWRGAANQKTGPNQPIKFNLYNLDAPGSKTFTNLGNELVYPNNDFENLEGSHIFSYKVSDDPDAVVDPILGFPLSFKSLGQISDIIFENDLQTERYSYVVGGNIVPISGYYYYRIIQENDIPDPETWTYENSWYESEEVSKQRVINRYTVFGDMLVDSNGNPTDSLTYNLSVSPHNLVEENMEVFVNKIRILEAGLETAGDMYFQFGVENGGPIVTIFNTEDKVAFNDSVEVYIYTYDRLKDYERGYFEIPKQLEANPNNEEVLELSYSDLTPHFGSIIAGQYGFQGEELGINNYHDSEKNPAVGEFILQNESSLLKTMFTSSTDDVDVIKATRFVQNEYVNFKNKFLKIVRQRDIAGYTPLLAPGDLRTDLWLEEVLAVVNVSKEFSKSFAYAYMISRSDVFRAEEVQVTTIPEEFTFDIDITDPKNTLYLYKIITGTGNIIDQESLLLIDRDYKIVDTNLGTTVEFISGGSVAPGDSVLARMYNNSPPAYIPATPAKLGMGPVYVPGFELDTTYVDPIWVIAGHDGSIVPAFGNITTGVNGLESDDIRDMLLLELEKRIYNGIMNEFRDDPATLLRIENIRPGWFRQNEPITDQSAINRYTREEYYTSTLSFFSKWTAENKADYRVNEFYDPLNWKTWNYSSQTYQGVPLPGYWRGIFTYFYDTDRPSTHPWEMLGFSIQPDWWETAYGTFPWDSSNPMWADIEAGLILEGNRAGVDPLFVRPGLSSILPVDPSGDPQSVSIIFGLPITGGWTGIDDNWEYGDGAPVEQSWYQDSGYNYSVLEFLYLMRPAEFGEKFWNPAALAYRNGNQLLDITTNERLKNSTQIVHAETIDDVVAYRTGYQQYISDRLLFLGKNITNEFGNRIRRVDVNLGYKMGAFTDQDTIRVKLQSSSTESDTGNLIIPTTNYQVYLYTGSSVKDYTYSGVIVRANADGTFTIYGYDLLSQSFGFLPASPTSRRIQINQGGTPAAFRDFEFGVVYKAGEIVRYNTFFYQAKRDHTADSFLSNNWSKLAALPQQGGITVTYLPDRIDEPQIIPYASIMQNSQEVYDFLIGYGAYLESQGWKFEEISNLNQVQNWKLAASQFLFWVVNEWAADNAIFLSPAAEATTLEVEEGYPASVERLNNGVYSILDKRGVSILPSDTLINRDDKFIQVVPKALGTGVYYLRVSATETEHVMMFDNITEFNDVIYAPLLRVRQDRLEWTGIKTLDWFGKLQAGGFLVQDNSLIQNFDNIVESMRYYYDTESTLDNPEIEQGARHLIGHENRVFLDQLGVSDDVQFNFYQGFIRQKGTENAIDKLLRSDEIQDKEEISYTEEWAIKLADFGGTQDHVNSEFVSFYDEVKGDPQTFRFNFALDRIGSVKEIILFNTVNLYDIAPSVIIAPPDARNEFGLPPSTNRQATAIAILGSNKRVARIAITDPGYGYTVAPKVTIVGNPISTGTAEEIAAVVAAGEGDLFVGDTAWSVLQLDLVYDAPNDTIVDIDIDDTDQWITRPRGLDTRFVVPIAPGGWDDYQAPNAGYVHRDDVDFMFFDADDLHYQMPLLESVPPIGSYIWIAYNRQEDWGVYKVGSSAVSNLRVSSGANTTGDPNLDDLCLVDVNEAFFNFYNGITIPEKEKRVFNAVFSVEESGRNTSGQVIITGPDNFKNSYTYVYLGALDGWVLATPTGEFIRYSEVFEGINPSNIGYFGLFNQRFADDYNRNDYGTLATGRAWIDEVVTDRWAVKNDSLFWRIREPLINTELYQSSFIRERDNGETVQVLAPYDPFKDIIAGNADQNISFKSARDPARYTHSDDPRLINPSNVFGQREVGRIWWDLSRIRYMYYEQPPTLNWLNTGRTGPSAEELTDSLVYRRDNWGKVFPGSSADIYEWVESSVPPAEYNGDGTPRNETDYVREVVYDKFKHTTEVRYYFWVTDTETVPDSIPNRTLTTIEISRLIINPRSYNYEWYAPVQYTESSTSLIFANVDRILSNRNVVIQVNYQLTVNANEEHSQWLLLGEGDRFSIIPDVMWDKMVNSLVGYTKPLPADQYPNGLSAGNDLVILPVPNPYLSDEEKYGIGIRPEQNMFVNIQGARKIMAQKVNLLMSEVMLWQDRFDNWDADITSSIYWEYTDWFNVGYNTTNTTARRQVEDTSELFAIKDELVDSELVKVYPFTPTVFDRYQIYEFDQEADEFVLVRYELGTMRFKDSIYIDTFSAILRLELRQVLTALKDNVFIDELRVDENLLYFAMVNYAFSEQRNIDWAFKTTYIKFLQDNVLLRQKPNFEADLLDEFLSYVHEAKPYHTKVRDATTVLVSTIDQADGNAWDDAIGTCPTPENPPNEEPWLWREGFGPHPVDPNNNYLGLDESWRWDNICVDPANGATLLRKFKIILNYSRVWCKEEDKAFYMNSFVNRWDDAYNAWDSTNDGPGTDEWDRASWGPGQSFETEEEFNDFMAYLANTQVGECNGTIIDGSGFIFGWDSTPWQAQGAFITYNGIVGDLMIDGLPIDWGNTAMTWQGEEFGLIIDSEEFTDEPTTLVDAEMFGNTQDHPEEMVPITPSENVVINVNYLVWNPNDQNDLNEVGYKLEVSPLGYNEYSRTCTALSTILVDELDYDTSVITVNDASILPTASVTDPGVIWIDAERIEYSIVSGNTLSDVRRGTLGTTIAQHEVGAAVWNGGDISQVPDPYDTPVTSTIVPIYATTDPITDDTNWGGYLERQLQLPFFAWGLDPGFGLRATYDVVTTSYWGIRTLNLTTPIGQECTLEITLGENPLGDPNVTIRIGEASNPDHIGLYAANATHTITFTASGTTSDVYIFKDGATVANETFVVQALALSEKVLDSNQIQQVSGINGVFNTFTSDPWFGVITVPDGNGGFELETDAAGDVKMYNTTTQSSFLVNCPYVPVVPIPPPDPV